MQRVGGSLRPPSDKSLSHRAYMFGAMAAGPSIVRKPLHSEDCLATLRCLEILGMQRSALGNDEWRLTPRSEWLNPSQPLDCGNSGTTMRLLSGLVASRPVAATLIGDASLSRRPMKRIAEPLRLMGATIAGETAPLEIVGGSLNAIRYHSPVASGQIKSCVLFAALRATGTTEITEPALSRDHTERMLAATGVKLDRVGLTVSLQGGQAPTAFEFTVPADISSAAFPACLAALHPGTEIVLTELGLNPSRTGMLDVLKEVGVDVTVNLKSDQLGEPFGDVTLRSPDILKPFTIAGDLVPRLIDEIPVLAVLATQCHGTSVIRDAREMRVKETDRIETMARGLRAMGATVETFEDGMAITGPTMLSGVEIEAGDDHRIAMSFFIAGSIAAGSTRIHGAHSIQTSYPKFVEDMRSLIIE